MAGLGHTVELAYLLLNAGRAVRSSLSSKIERVARAIALTVLQNGRDPSGGGVFDRPGTDHGAKTWWVEAEAMNTWAAMYELDQEPLWLKALEEEWGFIRAHIVDREHGGWITQIPGVGQASRLFPKSDAWTDPYHNVRALINGLR
jgi:mannobiose 2-epimerase